MMGVGATFMGDNIVEEDAASFKLLYQGLQFFDDIQLEQIADSIANSLIQVAVTTHFYSYQVC